MSKPIPKSHGTPYSAPKPSNSSPKSSKNPGPPNRRAEATRGPDADRKPSHAKHVDKTSIAGALLGRAQQENPTTSGGAMHTTNSSVHAPEDSVNADSRELGLSGSTSEETPPTKRATGKASPRPPKADRR